MGRPRVSRENLTPCSTCGSSEKYFKANGNILGCLECVRKRNRDRAEVLRRKEGRRKKDEPIPAKPCKKCGGTERRMDVNGRLRGCAPCGRERGREAMKLSRRADPEKFRIAQREWRKQHPEYHRAGSLKKNFGITVAQYDQMAAEQDNACAICRGHNLSGKRLAVDHDHTSGKIRSLLCSRCNTALGQLREQPGLCRAAAEYLERWQSE